MEDRKTIQTEEKIVNNKNTKRTAAPPQKKKQALKFHLPRAAKPSFPIDLLAALPGDTIIYPNRDTKTPAPSPNTSRTNPVLSPPAHPSLPPPRSFLKKIKETSVNANQENRSELIPPPPLDNPPPPLDNPPPPLDNPPSSLQQVFHLPKGPIQKTALISLPPTYDPPPLIIQKRQPESIPKIVIEPAKTFTVTNKVLNNTPQVSNPMTTVRTTLQNKQSSPHLKPLNTPKIQNLPPSVKAKSTPPLNVTQTLKKPPVPEYAPNKSSPSGTTMNLEGVTEDEQSLADELDDIYDQVIEKKALINLDDGLKKQLEEVMRIHKENFNKSEEIKPTIEQPPEKKESELDEIQEEKDDELIEMPFAFQKEKKKPSLFSFFCCCKKDPELQEDTNELLQNASLNRGRYSPR